MEKLTSSLKRELTYTSLHYDFVLHFLKKKKKTEKKNKYIFLNLTWSIIFLQVYMSDSYLFDLRDI